MTRTITQNNNNTTSTFWVEQSRDAQVVLCGGEGTLEVDSGALLANLVHVHKIGPYRVNYGVKR